MKQPFLFGLAAAVLALATTTLADTVTIQYFLGNVSNTPTGAIGVLVADVNSDGFDSVYKAGIEGNSLSVGDSFVGSDDIIIGVTSATQDGFQGSDVGFADTFAPIDYGVLGVSAGTPIRFFWFPATNSGNPVIATPMGFQSYDSASPGTGGNSAYVLPPAPGVYTLTHLDSLNGGAVDPLTPAFGQVGPILEHPVGGAYEGGSTVYVPVATQGAGPYSFEWFEGLMGDVTKPVGSNSSTLELLNILYSSTYWVRILDNTGQMNSMDADVDVFGGGLRPKLFWSPIAGAEWYNLYITKDGSLLQSIWIEGNSNFSWAPTSNLGFGNYTWKVRGWTSADGNGSWLETTSFSIGIPDLLTPAGEQPTMEVRPEFTWTKSLGAEYYKLYIAKDGALWHEQWLQGGDSTSWQASAVMPPGNYTYWVAPWSAAGGQGPYSNSLSFSMGIPQPVAPSGTLSGGEWRPIFSWSASPSSEWYYLYISRNGELWKSEWIQGSSNTTWQSSAEMPAGEYTFRVAPWTSADGQGGWSNLMSFAIGASLPGPVGPSGQQNKGVSMPEFSWTDDGKNEWFNIYLQLNGASVASPWIEGVTNWTPSSILASGNYKWWIRGWNSIDKNSAWVAGPDFEIQGLMLTSPVGITSSSPRPEFIWDAEPGATFYKLYISTGGTTFFSGWLDGVTAWTPTTDMVDGNYSWWVQPFSPSSGNGAWVGPASFVVEAVAPAAGPSSFSTNEAGGSEIGVVNASPAVASGDFNDDSVGDLVLQDSDSGEAKLVFLSGGLITGESYLSIQPGEGDWEIVGHGDFDNDLNNDLVWQNSQTGEVVAWLLDNVGTVNGTVSLDGAIDTSLQTVTGVADFDGDGFADLLLQDSTSGQLQLVEFPSSGSQSIALSNHSKGSEWSPALAADFDGDDSVDILWQNEETGLLALASNGVESSLGLSLVSGQRVVAAQDVNADNEVDLIVQDADSGKLTVWYLSEGSITSTATLGYQPDSSNWEVKNARPIK